VEGSAGERRSGTGAGMFPSRAAVDLTEDEWHRVIDVSLTSTLLFSQAAARSMIELRSGGVIVNVCSRAGLRPQPGMLGYSAAKVGVVSLTQTMAQELAYHGIRVNAVAPGPVSSGAQSTAHGPAVGGFATSAEWKASYYSRIPMKRGPQSRSDEKLAYLRRYLLPLKRH
jgi:NAD(P)-dependent dehydrogenase (short-subunit alcohol dehydrogenase family)